MGITGLFRAAGSLPHGRAGAVVAATAVPLAAILLAGCGGGGHAASALAARRVQPAEAPVRTMQLEKHYKDADGNRFAIEIDIGPVRGDPGICAELSPANTYTHALTLTFTSEAAKSKKVRLPRVAVRDRAATFTSTDKSGVACSTIVSTSDRTVLRGGQHKQLQALVSRPSDGAGDLVLTIWPKAAPQKDLLRIPFRSLP
ncbi:MAG TPA: hypothetical protein VF486_12570 [Actinomycetes bacterium]